MEVAGGASREDEKDAVDWSVVTGMDSSLGCCGCCWSNIVAEPSVLFGNVLLLLLLLFSLL